MPQDRIRKFTEENKELAANLKAEMEKLLNPAKLKAAAAKKKAAGSDLSSTRGSEERLTPVMGRGQKRGRDYEIEKVRECPNLSSCFHSVVLQYQSLTCQIESRIRCDARLPALVPCLENAKSHPC